MRLNEALINSVAVLECGHEQGTATLLGDGFALAAGHSIVDHLAEPSVPIQLRLPATQSYTQARALDAAIPVTEDIILLRFEAPIATTPIPLAASHIPFGLPWSSFGFPTSRSNGFAIRGTVARWLPGQETPRDLELEVENFSALQGYQGFSGAPIVANGSIVAILQRQLAGGLGAISILRLREYLSHAGIPYAAAERRVRIPPAMAAASKSSVPNTRAFWDLENKLSATGAGYITFSGPPGSGKTLVAATFQPSDAKKRVIGCYFAGGDSEPGRLAADLLRGAAPFADWLASEASLVTQGAVPSLRTHTLRENAETIAHNLDALAKFLRSRDELGVLFVDDAVSASGDVPSTSLLRALPPTTPQGLAVVLTTTNPSFLSVAVPDLTLAGAVAIAPLDLFDCQIIAGRALGARVPASFLLKVAEASEGNPLVLSYIIREIEELLSAGETPTAPTAGSTLDQFHEKQWLRIAANDSAVWLVATIARIRGQLAQSELSATLPDPYRTTIMSAMRVVQHLLITNESEVRFFHASFRDFALSKTHALSHDVHARLASYCASAAESDYGIANIVFHHLRASRDYIQHAYRLCTDTWADAAAARGTPPPHVLTDTTEVLEHVLREGAFVDAIRVLLLRSRLHFRYNYLLGTYAAEFAACSLVIINSRAALDAVLRAEQLICSPAEAAVLIRRCIVAGAPKTAVRLFRVLERECFSAYESGTSTETLAAHFEALGALMLELGTNWAQDLHRLYGVLELNLPNAEARDLLSAQLGGLPQAAQLWRFGWFAYPARAHERDRGKYGTELALIVKRADELERIHGRIEPQHPAPAPVGDLRYFTTKDAVREVEAICRNFGVVRGSESHVVDVLIRHCGAPDAVARVAKKAKAKKVSTGLTRNGVDVDLTAVEAITLSSMASAYLGRSTMSSFAQVAAKHPWEANLVSAFKWLGACRGRRYRALHEGQPSNDLLQEISSGLLPLITFSLQQRIQWTNAYNIPEQLFPRLLSLLGELVATFAPEAANDLVSLLRPSLQDQMGVYTEGFRRALSELADMLALANKPNARELRRFLFEHIKSCTANRNERIAALLDCAFSAATQGSPDLARSAFQHAIRSSTGPGWYKEDQFRLPLDVLETLDDTETTRKHWRAVAELLEIASGDVTFQRDIREQKARLIRHLASVGCRAEAAAMFRHYLFPDDVSQKDRIASWRADQVEPLKTGRFGVRETDEQAAALAILEGLPAAGPLRRWAVVELFFPGDDRYYNRFAKIVCELATGPKADAVRQRLLRLVAADFAPAKRAAAVRALKKADTTGALDAWLALAKEHGVTTEDDGVDENDEPFPDKRSDGTINADGTKNSHPVADRDPELILPGTFGRKAPLEAFTSVLANAEHELQSGESSSAFRLLIEGLVSVQAAGWNAWNANESCAKALRLILQQSTDPSQGLRTLRELVLNERHADDWAVAHFLIGGSSREQLRRHGPELLSAVMEHIRLLLRPELEMSESGYETRELEPECGSLAPESALDHALIAALNHPNMHARERAASVLYWLATEDESFDAQIFCQAVREREPTHTRELSAGILHALARNHVDVLKKPGILLAAERLLTDPNAAIRYAMADVCERISDEARSPHSSPDPGNPAEQNVSDTTAHWEWRSDLRALLQGPTHPSVELARRWLVTLSSPLTPRERTSLWEVRNDAFDGGNDYWSTPLEREAVLRTIDLSSSPGMRGSLMWNPLWPDASLRCGPDSGTLQLLSRILRQEFDEGFVVDGKLFLHAHIAMLNSASGAVSEYEIGAFIAPTGAFDGKVSPHLLFEQGLLHQLGTHVSPSSSLTDATLPAVRTFAPRPLVGGWETPAMPTQRLLALSNVPETSFERWAWRDGRVWGPHGVGPPLRNGTALATTSAKLLDSTGYDLVWQIKADGEMSAIVDPVRRRIYLGPETP